MTTLLCYNLLVSFFKRKFKCEINFFFLVKYPTFTCSIFYLILIIVIILLLITICGIGADMEKYYDYNNGQMTLTDRVAIEVGLARGDTFGKIARTIKRHPATISREIKENRTHIHPGFPHGNDCRFYSACHRTGMCGVDECDYECRRCKGYDCHVDCEKYESAECLKILKPPYVCNTCSYRRTCNKTKYFYNARHAEAVVSRRRSSTRSGPRLSADQIKDMERIIIPLLNKGQPLAHIYAEHENEMPITLRALYQYIDKQQIRIKSIDLRRKVTYRRRKIKSNHEPSCGNQNQQYRIGRTYEDYEKDVNRYFSDFEVVEMDTVKGVREQGKRLLTMIFRKNSIMLLFLMPDGKADSVNRVFDYLEAGLGLERFQRLFPVFLTDNGSEFKRVDDLELDGDYLYRTKVFYCDPMASWQKPHIEKNHEYIRYVIPKGKSMNPYTQEDITLLMNHINSTKRPGLHYKSPYELVEDDDVDMKVLMDLLKMHLIPADEVHLTPDLLK